MQKASQTDKRLEQATATPTLSQRLTQTQQEVGETSHPKLDWMI
ncbi:hypothetical protein Gotur_013546 [Gossypium turneri]